MPKRLTRPVPGTVERERAYNLIVTANAKKAN